MEDIPLQSAELGSSIFKWNRKILFYVLGVIVLFILFYFFFLSGPSDFPKGAIVNIPEGSSLRSVSLKLKNESIIRSRTAFEAFAILYGGERHVIPADYYFEDSASVWEVARRITRGDRHLAPVKVTIPEGFTYQEIADSFSVKLTNFDKNKFLAEAKPKEGYLFPDTYFFFTTDTEAEVLISITENYEKRISPIRKEILASGKTEKEIIIMASVIEGEAKGEGDRATIAGILYKRLSIGMPLQADAAPETYKAKGLPKAPIGNPGIKAIEAAIHPKSSPYLYYIHDKQGEIHYAKTLAEHNANIRKYLK